MKKLLALLLMTMPAFCCGRVGAEEDEPIYRQLNARAISAFRQGNNAEAEALYKKALEAYIPEKEHYDQTIKHNLALLFRATGKTEEAAVIESSLGSQPTAKPTDSDGSNSSATTPKLPGAVEITRRLDSPPVLPVSGPALLPLVDMGRVTVIPSSGSTAHGATGRRSPTSGVNHTECAVETPLSKEDANVLIDFCANRARSVAMSKHPGATRIFPGTTRAYKTGKDEARIEVHSLVMIGTKMVAEHLNFRLSTKGGEITVLNIASVAAPPTPASTVRHSVFNQLPTRTATQEVNLFQKPEGEEPEQPPLQQPPKSILSGFEQEGSFGGNTSFQPTPWPTSPAANEPEPTQTYTPPQPPPSGGT